MNNDIFKTNNNTGKFKFIKPNSKPVRPEFLTPALTNKMKDLLKAPKIKLFKDIKYKHALTSDTPGNASPLAILKQNTIGKLKEQYPKINNTLESSQCRPPNIISKTPDRDFYYRKSIKQPIKLLKTITSDKQTMDLSSIQDKKDLSMCLPGFRKLNTRNNKSKTEELSIIDNLIDGLSKLKTIIQDDDSNLNTNPTM
jgi:hypothetical protein